METGLFVVEDIHGPVSYWSLGSVPDVLRSQNKLLFNTIGF
jgi:hypothetical protein